MKRATSAVVSGLLAVMLTGCSGGDELTIATYEPTGEGGFSAELAGTLTRTESGCLTITSSESSVVPVFPNDAILVDGESILYKATTYSLGDPISLGGGMVTNQKLPADCVGESDVFIVSANP